MSAGFFVVPPTRVRVNDVVIFFVAFKLLPFSLSFLLTARNISVLLLGSCQVLVMESFAFSFRLSKVGSLIEWKLSSSFRICCKNPYNPYLNSFSSRSLVDVRLQGDPVVQNNVVFPHPMSKSDFLYFSSPYHLESIVGWPPCFSLSGFLKHLLRMEVHLLPFRSTVLDSKASVFFFITYPGIEVTSRLFWWNSVGLREDFMFLPQLQQIIPNSQQALQSGHCCLEEFSQISKISVLFMSAIKSCESWLNLLIFSVCLKS